MRIENRRTPTALLITLILALILTAVELPAWGAVIRPMFVPLVVFFWVLRLPAYFGLISAWIMGLCVDVLSAGVLGQNALALGISAFLVLKLREILKAFPAWQQALVIMPLWALYAFILFWIDGTANRSADPLLRWAPVISTTLCWPLLVISLNRWLRPSSE